MGKEPLAPELYKMLVDPLTKEKLQYSPDKKWLIAPKSRHKYPIKKGIPVLLPPSYGKVN